MKHYNDKFGIIKRLHALCAFCICAFYGTIMTGLRFSSALVPAVIALVLTLATYVGWELCCRKEPDYHFCVWNLLAVLTGAICAVILIPFAYYFAWHAVAGNTLKLLW